MNDHSKLLIIEPLLRCSQLGTRILTKLTRAVPSHCSTFSVLYAKNAHYYIYIIGKEWYLQVVRTRIRKYKTKQGVLFYENRYHLAIIWACLLSDLKNKSKKPKKRKFIQEKNILLPQKKRENKQFKFL